mmetsp:Transcript_16858/g.23110  ORF Transcript_16858/g.23110 Transcript_16858/m.23110 type:complete len:101 (+) Transcript_16858:2692-2994(+)
MASHQASLCHGQKLQRVIRPKNLSAPFFRAKLPAGPGAFAAEGPAADEYYSPSLNALVGRSWRDQQWPNLLGLPSSSGPSVQRTDSRQTGSIPFIQVEGP